MNKNPQIGIKPATDGATAAAAGFVAAGSVALKWVLPEADSDAAAALLEADVPLAAPAFIFVEMTNALWIQAQFDPPVNAP